MSDFFRSHKPILVASMGRSGSTLCWRAISEALVINKFGAAGSLFRKYLAKRIRSEAWDLRTDRIFPGRVYKTHALADELPSDFDGRIVFLFGCASDAALSVVSCRQRYGEDWVSEHFQHLRAIGSFDELGNYDVLQFEKQIETWTNLEGHNIICLRYEKLWDNVSALSEFLGFNVELPERRIRTTHNLQNLHNSDLFLANYKNLDDKISDLPDLIIKNHTDIIL